MNKVNGKQFTIVTIGIVSCFTNKSPFFVREKNKTGKRFFPDEVIMIIKVT